MKNLIYILFVFTVLTGCTKQNKQPLTIATAANMQFAMADLSKAFEAETGIACEVILGSSGKLTAQIMQGAPYDVFVSADLKYPKKLFSEGFCVRAPQTYAYGKLVLFTTLDKVTPSMEMLLADSIQHIAVANPKTAPYGEAAFQTLQALGMLDQIEHKLVYGESIAQTNQFITSGAAEMGFTAKSVVLSSEVLGTGYWYEPDRELYTPIAQGVAVLKQGKKSMEEAEAFYNFLFSKPAKKILNKFGYLVRSE